MQEFLSILKTEGAIKDGTIDIHQALNEQRMERMLSTGDFSQKDANNGINLRFNNVTFGYTSDRTVSALCSRLFRKRCLSVDRSCEE